MCYFAACQAHFMGAIARPAVCVCHRLLPSPSDMTTATIIHRIVHNRAQYEARNAKKSKSEAAYYSKQKTFVQEG